MTVPAASVSGRQRVAAAVALLAAVETIDDFPEGLGVLGLARLGRIHRQWRSRGPFLKFLRDRLTMIDAVHGSVDRAAASDRAPRGARRAPP